ncbi:uncharacterized protein LOC124940600 [Impatiens glandulifera]|uniref:uncharacterized protein LOC124940600 n=1 Tax=Impatiens glandulifera TaxID=253017 RepID=UPI001FB0C744|nr:uncharacterized protein LOC124940600 [Impatiens glandulifera]
MGCGPAQARTKRYIVRGLRPEYTPFIISIQGWAQQPSLEKFENLLSSQESLAAQMDGTSIKEESNRALFVKKSSWKKGKSKNEETDQDSSIFLKKLLKCFRCGKTRHFKRNCRVNLNENFASSNIGEKSDQRVEEDWDKIFHVNVMISKENKTEASHDKHETDQKWIVDLGCGHHVTRDNFMFSSSRIHNEGGDIVTNVYHVLGTRKKLFLLTNVVDAGNLVLFGPHDVKFLRNVKEIKAYVVHTRTRVNDLFVLSSSTSYIEKVNDKNIFFLWYARLGHLNMTKFSVMSRKKFVEGLLEDLRIEEGSVCEGCQYGKAHQLPFDNSISKSKGPLNRVHSDLMGQTRTVSYSGSNICCCL